jgi:NADPH:quinone reductase
MRSIIVSEHGGPEVLRYADNSAPIPSAGQVTVHVQTIGVNYADIWMRQGRYPNPAPLPFVPGWEVIGTVGQRRVAVPLFAHGVFTGGYSDTVLVDAGALIPIPDGVSNEAAAALLMQGTTAHFLLEHVRVRGRRVLITAAAGGVGTLLVQLARCAGAETIIALASGDLKLARVRELGADIAIDYTRPEWVSQVEGVDLVLDSVGGAIARATIELLAPGGTYVVYGAASMDITTLDAGQVLAMGAKNQFFSSFSLAPALADIPRWRAGLHALFQLITEGSLRTVGSTWPLAEAAAAHRAIEARTTIGKVTLRP